ncbi:MAG: LysM peptidoglycan-binding domain-containing protein [Chloroflexi bacterium]|nr:LysM peptidoglycan-binding domain-containing protein [Chloroflexota bacterium]
MRKLLLICTILISACAAQPAQGVYENSPIPYVTSTPSLTSTPNVLVVDTTPIPTSTPFIYTIKSGDTLSGLAERFKVSINEIRAANPDVSPNSMTIGSTLLIPDPSAAKTDASTPTPAPAPVTQTVCHPSSDGGLTCFALIQNNSNELLENVSAKITLLDKSSKAIASQTAFLPLDFIPPNSSMPVYVFFPDQVPANVQIQILTANQLSLNNQYYLPAVIQNSIAQINASGRTAQVSGLITMPAESKAATQVWVAAVAYDKDGVVVGLRRWEGGALQPAGNLSFSFSVSSLASAIDSVEFFIEARP